MEKNGGSQAHKLIGSRSHTSIPGSVEDVLQLVAKDEVAA